MRSMPDLLDLNDVLNGLRDGRRFELQTFCELICDFGNERKCALEQQSDAGHLPQDIGSEAI
jgi:hypothetical protein